MENELNTEFLKAIRSLNISNLNNEDKRELLNVFNYTTNPAIRNHIALIFADIHYHEAIPFILKKINDKTTFNRNGTLVFCLGDLDLKPAHFVNMIRIICDQGYEAQITAYSIIHNLIGSISESDGKKALEILENHKQQIKESTINDDMNTLDIINNTIELIKGHFHIK